MEQTISKMYITKCEAKELLDNTIDAIREEILIEGRTVEQLVEGLKPIIEDIIEQLLMYKSEDIYSYNIFYNDVSKKGICLEGVPYRYRDYKLCKAAVEETAWAIEYVPTDLEQYEELCMIAVQSRPFSLCKVITKGLDRKTMCNLCNTAVKLDKRCIATALEIVEEFGDVIIDYAGE